MTKADMEPQEASTVKSCVAYQCMGEEEKAVR